MSDEPWIPMSVCIPPVGAVIYRKYTGRHRDAWAAATDPVFVNSILVAIWKNPAGLFSFSVGHWRLAYTPTEP